MDLTTMLKRYKDPNQASQAQQSVPNQSNGLHGALTRAGLSAMGVQNQQQTPNQNVFQQPKEFSYDAASDPQLANALQQANASAKTATNDAMVGLGARGIGNSSIAVDRGNQIQQAATSNVYTNMLPQFIKQAYDQYQNGIANKFNVDSANYNVGRDQIGDNQWQQGFNQNADSIKFNQGIATSEQTGNYTNPDLVGLLKQQSENSAAWANATPEQRAMLHQKNIDISKQLGQTYNPQTGSYSEANTTSRTIAGQQADLNNQGQSIQNKLAQFQLDDYPAESKARATILQQQVASGKLTNEMADYNFKQLKDPNSIMNQSNALDLKIKKLQADSLPEKTRLELENLRKTNAEIGVVHYKPQTAAEIEMDKVQLDTAKKQLEILNGKADTPKPINPKESTDNLTFYQGQLDSRPNLSFDQQISYAQSQKPGLSDSDYDKLIAYINKVNGK